MLIKHSNGNIILKMVQGDTEELSVKLYDDGEEAAFSSGDVVTLTVRAVGGTTDLVSSSATAAAGAEVVTLEIKPSQTSSITASWLNYVWDLQIKFSTGEVKTIVPRSPFVLIEQVTT